MGSYSITANYCIDLTFLGVRQYENAVTGETITNRDMYHGIMSSNFCRNMLLDGCYLDRFDAHTGLYNATLKNSTFGFSIMIIGGGTLTVENVERPSGNAFITLRNDYNSIFDGDVVIKNCSAGSTVKSLISGNWVSHDAGLPNHMTRSVTADGLEIGGDLLYIFNVKSASKSALTDETNPLYLPSSVRISDVYKVDESGNKVGVTPTVSKNLDDAFSTLEIE